MSRKLFCELSPVCYEISRNKEILRRRLHDLTCGERFARLRASDETVELPNIVKSHTSVLVRRLHGVDIALQENKVTNIRLACERINGITIYPGETFSFWRTVGRPTARGGYTEGLVISGHSFVSGIGGGLCQMANMIHWLVLNSPLTVTELHHHSDALFPDERRRVPFGTGTSVSYNYIDYRFRNDTEQPVRILVWCEDGELCGELRSATQFPYRYRLTEENHHFRREGEKYYRISQVYRTTVDRASGAEVTRELILDNHSEVMYDYSLIPKEQIRDNEDIVTSGGTAELILSDKVTFEELPDGVVSCDIGDLSRYSAYPKKAQNGEIAYIIFTSGTTGEPKGVPITYSNLKSFTKWISTVYPLSELRAAAVLDQASFSFDLSVADVYYALPNGHTLVSLTSNELSYVADVLSKRSVNVCVSTPTFIKLCMTDPDFNEKALPSFRCAYLCGETLDTKTVHRLWERFPSLDIINAYGPTEATSAVSAALIRPEMLEEAYLPVGEVGKHATYVDVIDDEIVIAGESVLPGYLNGERGGFLDEDGRHMYRTGDVGRIKDGYLYCFGRRDRQIKYKGYRIELSDIEQNIVRLDGVRECAVVPVRSADGTVRYLAAYVTGDITCDIRGRLSGLLPEYMLPKLVRVVDSLPMTANGKTDRGKIENRYFKDTL